MPKAQTKATAPTPAPDTPLPVEYAVRIYPVKDSKYTLANANVDINGIFAIRGVKIIRGAAATTTTSASPARRRLASSSTMRCWMPMSSRSDSPSRRTMLPLRNRPCNHPQHKTYNLEGIIMKKFIKNTVNSIRANAIRLAATYRSGEGYIDTAVKILIAVVLGALLLAGLYALFGDVVMPTLNKRITEMFNYAG